MPVPFAYAGSMVDVRTETVILRPCAEVAAYAMAPDNAPTWYDNIRSAEWVTKPPLVVGSKVAFVAHFLGRRLAYTYEFVELSVGERLVMRTAEGPFPMETTYTFAPCAIDGSPWTETASGTPSGTTPETSSEIEQDAPATRMTLRNCGQPAGFSRMMAPLMAKMMRRANEKDLAQLKALLESAPSK